MRPICKTVKNATGIVALCISSSCVRTSELGLFPNMNGRDSGVASDESAESAHDVTEPGNGALVKPDAEDAAPDAASPDLDTGANEKSGDSLPEAAPEMPERCVESDAQCLNVDPSCTLDMSVPTTQMAWGQLAIPPTADLVPLCDGWVLLGDRLKNQIVSRNAFTGEIRRSYQLTAAPSEFELDFEHGFLYSALSNASFLVKVDFHTNLLTTIPLSGAATGLATGDRGVLFANVSGWVVLIDTLSGRELPMKMAGGDLLAYDKRRKQLFTGDRGSSASYLLRWAFDPDAQSLSQVQTRLTSGFGQAVVLSSNLSQLAYSVSQGAPYIVYDLDPTDIATVQGSWQTGPGPTTLAFSPDGTRLAATNFDGIAVFDAATHAELGHLDITLCQYGQLTKLAWSRSSTHVFAITGCGAPFQRDGTLIWYEAPRVAQSR
jgi:hypothetical protein